VCLLFSFENCNDGYWSLRIDDNTIHCFNLKIRDKRTDDDADIDAAAAECGSDDDNDQKLDDNDLFLGWQCPQLNRFNFSSHYKYNADDDNDNNVMYTDDNYNDNVNDTKYFI